MVMGMVAMPPWQHWAVAVAVAMAILMAIVLAMSMTISTAMVVAVAIAMSQTQPAGIIRGSYRARHMPTPDAEYAFLAHERRKQPI